MKEYKETLPGKIFDGTAGKDRLKQTKMLTVQVKDMRPKMRV